MFVRASTRLHARIADIAVEEVLPFPESTDVALVAVVDVLLGIVVVEVAPSAEIARETRAARGVRTGLCNGLRKPAEHAEHLADSKPVERVIRRHLRCVVAVAAADPDAAAWRAYLALARVVFAPVQARAGRWVEVVAHSRFKLARAKTSSECRDERGLSPLVTAHVELLAGAVTFSCGQVFVSRDRADFRAEFDVEVPGMGTAGGASGGASGRAGHFGGVGWIGASAGRVCGLWRDRCFGGQAAGVMQRGIGHRRRNLGDVDGAQRRRAKMRG